LHAPEFSRFVVKDEGKLKVDGCVAFHLQSLSPFSIEGKKVSLVQQGATLEIEGEWIQKASQYEDGVDCHVRPIWHLVLVSKPVRDFCLSTEFRVIWKETEQK
jgi:hypothetical protein